MLARHVFLACLSIAVVAAVCPMMGNPPAGHPWVPGVTPRQTAEDIADYVEALNNIDFDAVADRIETLLTDSKTEWPADFGNYGPFFIRLAWHCSGSYRASDGRGGCDGGRIRHSPESAWPDNGNLDKARELLAPIKEEFGEGLSWGDLIVLAGSTAIRTMGGPMIGFCGGRLDDSDGADSLQLGPTEEQRQNYPCLKADGTPDTGNAQCQAPLGASMVGLIYVNPAGPVKADGTRNVDPVESGKEIREVFGRMGFDDEQTVAVIGGGHAFGKCHGDPNGVSTSGFEGQWTVTPTTWSNLYFKELFAREDQWEVWNGPNGDADSPQWRIRMNVTDRTDIMMLTTDMAMIKDPAYRVISQKFANDLPALEKAFGEAWYALMSRDMGDWKRCVGAPSGANSVPAAQAWQLNLPKPSESRPNYDDVRADIKTKMLAESATDEFAYLGFRCAATYRYTDHLGGCNGAAIRFPPQNGWKINTGLGDTRALLQPIYDEYSAQGLTWADLITLAGIVAVEESGSPEIEFCGGMTDLTAAGVFAYSALRDSGPNEKLQWRMELMGLTTAEVVALMAMPRGDAQMKLIGRKGSWSATSKGVTNEYFTVLLGETWETVAGTADPVEYKAAGKEMYMTQYDKEILDTPAFKTEAEKFRDDDAMFKTTFQTGWSKMSRLGLMTSSTELGVGTSGAAGVSASVLATLLGSFLALAGLRTLY